MSVRTARQPGHRALGHTRRHCAAATILRMKIESNRRREPALRLALAAVLGLAGITVNASVLLADTVHLVNGRTLDGRAVVEGNGDVALYSSMGVIRLPKNKVAKIDRSDTVEDQILEQLDQLQSPTADDLYELAFEANRRGASTLARDLYREALRLNPEHAATLRALNVQPNAPQNGAATPRPSSRSARSRHAGSELEAEQLKLLRALRAQANAARVAELQRQLLLSAQLEAEAERRTAAESINYPHVTYGQVYWPANQVTVVQRSQPNRTGVSQPRGAAPPRRNAAPPRRSQRKNTIVTIPKP